MQSARLIPVSGIGSATEAEQRATSAFLAVLTVVRDLSLDLFAPLGASRAQRATVEAFTEVGYALDGEKIRPDGLVRITYGNSTWQALVEVKTGDNTLQAKQINDYWEVARQNGIDHVVTISNEIAPNDYAHPTPGLKVRVNSRVGVTHFSWTALLATAVKIKQHRGVSDPEQGWILGELIRYLEHPASGAFAFDDMGPFWVGVRDAAKMGGLNRKLEGIEDVCSRWDQLLRFVALRLGSEIGEDVTHVLAREHRDAKARLTHLMESLVSRGLLDGALRIPNTAGDLHVSADLRGQNLAAALEVGAPQDKGARGRISWLVNQLKDAPGQTVIESYAKNARTPSTVSLQVLRDDRTAGLGDGREASKFRVVLTAPMGLGRAKAGKGQGFISSVQDLVNRFYGSVVQDVTAWQPPAPKLRKPSETVAEPEREPTPPEPELSPPTGSDTVGEGVEAVEESSEQTEQASAADLDDGEDVPATPGESAPVAR